MYTFSIFIGLILIHCIDLMLVATYKNAENIVRTFSYTYVTLFFVILHASTTIISNNYVIDVEK